MSAGCRLAACSTSVLAQVNVETVVRNVQILAQTLASHLYNIPAPNAADVFNGTSAVDPAFVEAWLDYVAGTSRTPDNAQQPSKLLSEIQAVSLVCRLASGCCPSPHTARSWLQLMQKEGAEVKLSSHKLNGRYMGLFGLSKGTMVGANPEMRTALLACCEPGTPRHLLCTHAPPPPAAPLLAAQRQSTP